MYDLESNIRVLINQFSREGKSDTPDFILAEYLIGCLEAFERAVNSRDLFHGKSKSEDNIFLNKDI